MKEEMNSNSMTYEEMIAHFGAEHPSLELTIREVCQNNTGKFRTCVYIDGSLAGKENADGSYRLCNQFYK